MSGRSRNRDSQIVLSPVYKDSYYPTGPNGMETPYATGLFFSGGKSGELKMIDDIVTPDFRRLIANGAVIMNDFAISRSERTANGDQVWDTGIILNKSGENAGSVWGRLVLRGDLAHMVESCNPTGTIGVTSQTYENTYQMAEISLVKAHAKMKEPAVLTGEIVSDMAQTLSMIRHPFKAASTLLTKMASFKKKRFGTTGINSAKANASTWLEYRYGWRPLIGDMFSVADAVNKIRHRGDRRRSVSRSGLDAATTKSCGFSHAGFGAWSGLTATGRATVEFKQRVGAGVMYEVVNRTTMENVVAMLGLRPSDVPATLWEIIPYSFVVDWFTNVGSWLSAVTPDPDYRILGSWMTTVEKRKDTTSCVYLRYPFTSGDENFDVGSSIEGSSWSDDQVRRYANPPLPPTPSVTFNPLSLTRSIDAASLLLRPILAGLGNFKH